MGIHKKNRDWPAWGILIAMTMIFYLVSVSAPVFSEDYFIEYLISGQSCKIVYAVTPFDSNEKTRKVFLKWFKQGVETVLSARQPLDIEWQQAPEGQAGLKGYETGLQEGEACLKEIKKSGQPMHKTRKTPLEFFNTSGVN